MQKQLKIAYLSIIIVVVTAVYGTLPIASAQVPEIALKDRPIEEIVTFFARKNNVDPNLALSVMRCESEGKQSTVSDHGLSKGIFQIQEETWNRFTKKMGEKLDRDSSFDQARVATWAFANGHGWEWTTYVAIKNGGKYSFYSRQLKRHFVVTCDLVS